MNKKINISGVDLSEETAKSKVTNKRSNTDTKVLPLVGKKVAISVSVNEDLKKLGLSEHHINDISIEIARYIISNGGTALYAGDLRKGGFTEYFSELASQYISENDRKPRFINYFCFPGSREVTEDVQIEFKKKHIKAQLVPLPTRLRDIDTDRKYSPDEDIEDRRICSESFTSMRQHMAKDATARIVVGGKQYGFNGYIPGVIQETLLTLQENKPVYLIGGFGGATSSLISMLKGQSPIELHNDFQYNTELLRSFKMHIKNSFRLADYDELKKDIQSITLDRISDLNKLTMDENEILFTSKNIHEILYLVMKGLKAL